jgi:hypothetical protein
MASLPCTWGSCRGPVVEGSHHLARGPLNFPAHPNGSPPTGVPGGGRFLRRVPEPLQNRRSGRRPHLRSAVLALDRDAGDAPEGLTVHTSERRPHLFAAAPRARPGLPASRHAPDPAVHRRTQIRPVHHRRGQARGLWTERDQEPLRLGALGADPARRPHDCRGPGHRRRPGAPSSHRLSRRPPQPGPAYRGGQPRLRRAPVEPPHSPPGRSAHPVHGSGPMAAGPGLADDLCASPACRTLAIRSTAPDVGATDARRLRPGVATGRRRRCHRRRTSGRPDHPRGGARRRHGCPPLARRIAGSACGRARRWAGRVAAGEPRRVTPRRRRLFDTRTAGGDPWRGRSPVRVLWEEKRREDELRALDIHVVRVTDVDLGAKWPAVEGRLGRLLGTAGPAVRRFTATPRAQGVRRTDSTPSSP